MILHTLKIKVEYYKEVCVGNKKAELRKNDRDYKAGDLIHFVDIDGEEMEGFRCDNLYRITHVLKDVSEYGLDKDYCILSIERIE